MSNCCLPKIRKFVYEKHKASTGCNDVVVVKQDNGSLKASPLQVHIRVTSSIQNITATKQPKLSRIRVRDNGVDCVTLECSDWALGDVELTNQLSSNELSELKLEEGTNQTFFMIEELNVCIQFFIFLFHPNEKLVVTDIDGTITKSDTIGFFGGNLGFKVHHENVNKFFHRIHENGYKIIYMTARPIAFQTLTRKYLFETLKDNNSNYWHLPLNPVLCLPGEIADAALEDASSCEDGKTSSLSNVLNLFPDSLSVIVSAFGNNASDSAAYKNVGVPLNITYLIDKQSKIRNVGTNEEVSYTILASQIDTLFPQVLQK